MQRVIRIICIVLMITGTAGGAMADARDTLFNNGNPTYSGIIAANDEFEQALVDSPGDQTVMLFLAVTKLAVFGLENGDNPAVPQTFRDLYEAFGISRSDAESIMEAPITHPPTVFEEYDPPDTMPNGDEFQTFLAGPFLTLINEVIGYVDGVTNQAIKINIMPEELGDTTGIEVDYGDVLLLRSFLYTFKAFILLVDSYNMDALDIHEFAVLINSGVMQLRRDIFDRYANFLKLKQTNPPPPSLAASKTALVTAIDTCQEAYDFIVAEGEPQEDDLFAFGSQEEQEEAEGILAMMDAFKTSLDANDPMEFVTREIEWELTNPSGDRLGIRVEIDENGKVDGHAWGIDNNCNFLFCGGGVNQYVIDGNQITFELETNYWCNDDHWETKTSTLIGTLVDVGEQKQISGGTYNIPSCFGDTPGTFTGVQVKDETETVMMDFNRIFGNTGKNAVNIHDVMPEFDVYDEPILGTFPVPEPDPDPAPVLGGFFPDIFTNADATMFFELQPSEPFTIPTRTVTFTGDMEEDWPSNALLHDDIESDNDTDITGTDIKKVYLAKDATYLYVGMTLYDGDPNTEVIYGLGFRNWAGDGYMPLKLFAVYDSNYSTWVVGLEDSDGNNFSDPGWFVSVGTAGANCVEWKIPLNEITSRLDNESLSGKFVTTGTRLIENESYIDFNETRIQLDPATLTGNFSCPYDGTGNIFVKVMGESNPNSDWELGSTWVPGNNSGTYTINGLPAGQNVYVYAFWDKDDNGVITYADYGWGTPDDEPLKIEAGTNSLNIDITQSILDIVGPFEVMGSFMYVHQPDGRLETYYDAEVGNFSLGSLPDGVTAVTVKDPAGNVILTKDDFEFLGEFNEFFVAIEGEPQLGTYEFSVTAGGLTITATDTQYENLVVPLPDMDSFEPANGTTVDSMTPIFSWDAVDFDNACYRLEINDQDGNRVYATGYVQGMLSTVVPIGKLQPGQTYFWRVRITDDENWKDIQNRANSEWVEFTMADTLSHDATPALDLDGWGVVVYSGGDDIVEWTNLDTYVKVIDHDGIAPDGSSHTVTLEFPDGIKENLFYDYSASPTVAYYYRSFGGTPDDGEYIFRVVDPSDNSGQITDDLTVNLLAPPRAVSPAMNESVTDTCPTFQWNAVDGANRYRIRIYNMDGGTVMRGNAPNTTAWTVPPGILAPNTEYKYRVEARDAHISFETDSSTMYPASSGDYIRFTTGSETGAPYIDLDSNGVHTWNHADVGHNLSFWIKVHDAEGVPGNIKSVKVRFPDYATSGKEETLYFDYNESDTCGIYRCESFLSIQGDTYTFVAEDNEGHITERSEQLDINYLTQPDNWGFDIQPQPDGDGTGFNFAWDAVEDGFSGFYRLEIYDRNYNRLDTFATEQTEYNLAPGFLEKHELYRFRITARREFFDQNVDNGASMPWLSDERPTWVAGSLSEGDYTPSIDLDSWGAVLYHYPHPIDGTDKYRLGFSVKVSDADGVPKNIGSVTATDGSTTWDLYYDLMISDTAAYYWRFFEITNPDDVNGKNYTFTVTDADENSTQISDDLVVNVLPIPEGLKPADGSSFYGTRPVIQWGEVEGASIYRARIYNGLYDTLHKGGYVEQPSYIVPPGVLDLNQIFSYRVRACREDFRQDGVDLDNLSCSELLATSIQPHVTTRDLDLGGSILTLQAVAGMAPEGISVGADIDGDGDIGLAEAIYGIQKEADLR